MFTAWQEFKRGKEQKKDVQDFALNVEDQLFALHAELRAGSYRHGNYAAFFVRDPKLRHIHKASVIDRVLHHAVFRKLELVFEKTFIFDSYSSRQDKGTHRAIQRLRQFAWQLSRNDTKTVWILKCDIRRFFDSVDQQILLEIMRKKISDEKVQQLIQQILQSFATNPGKGIPLGNLTSQLFSNIYLNSLDQFVKRRLGIKYYLRYADDFVILSCDKSQLEDFLPQIREFLQTNLKLELHPQKIALRKWRQGVDFLGYIIFPHHILLRTKTKNRMLKKIQINKAELNIEKTKPAFFRQSLQSYRGILRHCQGFGIAQRIRKLLNEK